MKIYDITQELFGCVVYPGDPVPEREILYSVEKGDVCNLTGLRMCAHNGTHMDAPYHFLREGRTIDQIPHEYYVGNVYVAEHAGTVTAADAMEMLDCAEKSLEEEPRRLLIKGRAEVSAEAARVFAAAGLWLLGNESQTVGPENAPMEVHKILLGADVALLEGVRLGEVPEGTYFLSAAPLNLAGADGAPCRAILISPRLQGNLL